MVCFISDVVVELRHHLRAEVCSRCGRPQSGLVQDEEKEKEKKEEEEEEEEAKQEASLAKKSEEVVVVVADKQTKNKKERKTERQQRGWRKKRNQRAGLTVASDRSGGGEGEEDKEEEFGCDGNEAVVGERHERNSDDEEEEEKEKEKEKEKETAEDSKKESGSRTYTSQEMRHLQPMVGRVVVQLPYEKSQYPMYRETNWKYSGPCMCCFYFQGPIWMLKGMGSKSRKKTKGFKKVHRNRIRSLTDPLS